MLLWLAVITLASTDVGSSARSVSLLPLRKGAHVVEYAVMAVLTWWALRRLAPRDAGGGSSSVKKRAAATNFWRTAGVVLAFGAVVAVVDEFHQTFVASRHGSFWDVAIDLAGVCLGLGVAWVITRRRGR